jgi:two-component system NtrC family response regulator
MKPLSILIIEDGQSQRDMLKDFLEGEGHSAAVAGSGETGLEMVRKDHFDLILLDYKMPGMNGIEVLEAVKGINPEIDVIMMTAFGTIETAVGAMKSGAADYITKPIDLEDLLIHLRRISERRTLIRENEVLRSQLKEKGITTDRIIFRSRAMEDLVNMAGRVAASRSTVLIQGESGTGKELLARLVHNLSPRSDRPIIVVNCGAIHENLLESELFGHEKGAFTGAVRRRIGYFEEADGGSLFLDEIGELTLPLQVKLLRFLQEREFQRLGGNEVIRTDVRIISATNRDLEARVREGAFREDLFYRLNVVTMSIPPLRERKDDIPPLVDYFLAKFSSESGGQKSISREARDLLMKYDYPGNVRELENILERATVISRDGIISVEDLPFRDTPADERRFEGKMKDSIEALELQMIRKAMQDSGSNQSKAADILGISERMLRYKLKKYGIKSDR